MNKELISRAVARRLDDVCARINRIDPQAFGEMASFVISVSDIFRDQADAKLARFSPPGDWAAVDSDCLAAIREVSLKRPEPKPAAAYPPIDRYLDQLKANTNAREPVFGLLAERYAWPLNFSFKAEEEVREYVLMRLMTTERARIEKDPPAVINPDDLLLKLNLIGVHAATTTDLRFLDALNYYYELLPATVYPEAPHAWLLVSWYALYARALNSWS